LATVRWGATKSHIQETVQEFEEKAFSDLPSVEKGVLELYKNNGSEKNYEEVKRYLTKYTNDFARAAMQKYWELGDKFWGMFARGF
jgi:hypothetical protein